MDGLADDLAVLGSERGSETGSFLATVGPWKVRELPLTADRIDYIWKEVQKSPSLFSDLTQFHAHAFLDLLQDPMSYWLEAVNEFDRTIGLIYVKNLDQFVDANVHILFFDRNLMDKGELVKEMVEIIFKQFPALHRLTACIPDIFFATKRLALRSGWTCEGKRREALLLGGRWVDEVIYGITAKEALRGTN